MSLLDDVSIVVTPNGYKAGELYAVIPVPTLGADVVVDGDFPTPNVNWSLTNTTIETDGAKIDNTIVTGFAGMSQLLLGSISGKQFVLTYDVTATNGEDVVLDNGTSLYLNTSTTGTNRKLYYTWDRGDNYLVIKRAVANTNVTIDNVILQELTSADMDVTRATAATRVDENGLVNYAEIIGGEEVTCGDFSCAVPTDYWTPTNAVISFANNQLTVDDTAGAGADSRASQNFVTESGKTYKVKFNRISTTTSFAIGIGNGSSYSNIILQGLGTDTGEYTLEFTATGVSSKIAFITGGNGISVWSNVSVKEVTRDNVPRIDYTGGGCPHILAEPQRTNLITYSEDFSNAAWQKSDITATPNSITSPDGTLNAYKLTKPTSSTPRLFELSVYPSTGVHTFTAFYKNLDGDSVLIRLDGGGNTANCTVDLTTNTLVNSGANIISSNITQLSDGWIRVSVTANILSTSWVLDAVNLFSISVGSSVYIWGAQLEVGSYATSYIPTSGSTVTRNQDIFTRDGIANLINSTEGVLFVEMAALTSIVPFNNWLTISDGTANNQVSIGFETNAYTTVRIDVGGVVQAYFTVSGDYSQNKKIAFKWKVNDFALWIDGVEVGTDVSGSTIGAGILNSLQFNYGAGGNYLNAKVKQLQVYKTALSDTQLAALTS